MASIQKQPSCLIQFWLKAVLIVCIFQTGKNIPTRKKNSPINNLFQCIGLTGFVKCLSFISKWSIICVLMVDNYFNLKLIIWLGFREVDKWSQVHWTIWIKQARKTKEQWKERLRLSVKRRACFLYESKKIIPKRHITTALS